MAGLSPRFPERQGFGTAFYLTFLRCTWLSGLFPLPSYMGEEGPLSLGSRCNAVGRRHHEKRGPVDTGPAGLGGSLRGLEALSEDVSKFHVTHTASGQWPLSRVVPLHLLGQHVGSCRTKPEITVDGDPAGQRTLPVSLY